MTGQFQRLFRLVRGDRKDHGIRFANRVKKVMLDLVDPFVVQSTFFGGFQEIRSRDGDVCVLLFECHRERGPEFSQSDYGYIT